MEGMEWIFDIKEVLYLEFLVKKEENIFICVVIVFEFMVFKDFFLKEKVSLKEL